MAFFEVKVNVSVFRGAILCFQACFLARGRVAAAAATVGFLEKNLPSLDWLEVPGERLVRAWRIEQGSVGPTSAGMPIVVVVPGPQPLLVGESLVLQLVAVAVEHCHCGQGTPTDSVLVNWYLDWHLYDFLMRKKTQH